MREVTLGQIDSFVETSGKSAGRVLPK